MTIDPVIKDYVNDNFEVYPDTPEDIVNDIREINEEHEKLYGSSLFSLKLWEEYNKKD